MEMGWKANVEVSPPCPRCGSSNTKFCYYNNYSLTQPRYFCKACRRYWTKGGSLRNVPVGGGCRKTRRAAKSTRPTSSSVPAPHEAEAAASTTSNIDLAAVYANFVNHAPPPEPNINVPFASIHLTSPSVIPDQEINAFFEFPPRFGGGSSIFPVGFDAGSSFMSMNHDLLPPLPGEETLPLWPNSDDVVQNHQIMNSGGHEENVELVNGNMSVFSGLNLEDIFRA